MMNRVVYGLLLGCFMVAMGVGPAASAEDEAAEATSGAIQAVSETEAPAIGELLEFELEPGLVSRSVLVQPDLDEGASAPGILIAHEWWGLNDYALSRAQRLADAGYVVLVVDLYGEGFHTDDPAEAAQRATGFYNQRSLWRDRLNLALVELRGTPGVDPNRTGAIGFCFGGTGVLELAYSGAEVDAVVSFHGNPLIPSRRDRRQIQASLLVLHGAADPFVPTDQLEAFGYAVAEAGADWQIVLYADAEHAFTNPAADGYGIEGVSYHPTAERRSDRAMLVFFEEVFAEPQPDEPSN